MRTTSVYVIFHLYLNLCCSYRNLNPWLSITSLQGATRNFPVYVAYANDPFGYSTPINSQNRSTTNLTFLKSSLHNMKNDKHVSNNQITSENNNAPEDITELDKKYVNFNYSNVQEPRTKRGVLHLYNMVSCATGCNPLIYKGYGCYCGFLGSGYAVDGIDRCCKMHDWCYDTTNCPPFLQYVVPYYWKCYFNKPLCAVDQGEFGVSGSCAQRLCECDRVLSECLSRFPCPSSRAICRSSPWRLLQNAFMNF